MTVAVRFAPSPTGLLHVGNIRAALLNFLFARRHGGSFLLRLDDTDRERSSEGFAEAIQRDLAWLGLKWDRLLRQSDRMERYAEALKKLRDAGRAYPCFETQAELDLKRKVQMGRGLPPLYDRAALALSAEEKARRMAEGQKPHWRFLLKPGEVAWDDVVQGPKSFAGAALSDPVLVRADGVPLYTFCSVVDDGDCGITHIIRGEDHVTNTAVQLQIFEALGAAAPPRFAHYPLLVSASGVEMSKRLGTLSIASLRDEEGIEPMAIASLLATLGTSEPVAAHATLDDLLPGFDLAKISRAQPHFDVEELRHLNARILHALPFAEVAPKLKALGLEDVDEALWNAVRPNLGHLAEVRFWRDVVLGKVEPVVADRDFVAAAAALLPSAPWDERSWSLWTEAVRAQTGRKGRELFLPLRLALTGVDHGPEMKALLPLIGPERAKARLGGGKA